MEHVLKQKVYFSDTDAYGVVWHGNYLRWLEMARVDLCEKKGYKLSQLEKEDIVLPVAKINIEYKQSAKLEDNIVVKSEIIEKGRFYFTFHQKITDESGKKTYIEATVMVVAVHKDGKLYRSLPESILKIID